MNATATSFHSTLPGAIAAWALSATAVLAAGVPDTGQDTCYDDTVADTLAASNTGSIARDGGTHPRQDCRYGQDLAAAAGALPRVGAGPKGFDYSKIGNAGAVLAASAAPGNAAAEWACTRDNVTGLVWEVKTAGASDLRAGSHTYAWYSSNTAANGGHPGLLTSAGCNVSRGSPCNTEDYVKAVNAAMLCGSGDWRTPSQRELLTLVDAEGVSPSIVQSYFPNTSANFYWSATSSASTQGYAWTVDFTTGHTTGTSKTGTPRFVRAVRGAPF